MFLLRFSNSDIFLFATREINVSRVVGGDSVTCFCGTYTPGFFRETKIDGLTQLLENGKTSS